jgi:hypothetical protein
MDDGSEYSNPETMQTEILAEYKTTFRDYDFPLFFLSAKDPEQTIDHWMKLLEFLKSSQTNTAASDNSKTSCFAMQIQEQRLNSNAHAEGSDSMVL